jgi:cobalamin biosynthesis protein CbiD
MYIRGNPTTRTITLREINGTRLEVPITVIFSENGVARVRDGLGEQLCDILPNCEIFSEEEDDTTE